MPKQCAMVRWESRPVCFMFQAVSRRRMKSSNSLKLPPNTAVFIFRICAKKQSAARLGRRNDRYRRASRYPRSDNPPQGNRRAKLGASVDSLRLVDEARGRGVDVTLDQYPTPRRKRASTRLSAVAQEGGRRKMLERLESPKLGGRSKPRLSIKFYLIAAVATRRMSLFHGAQTIAQLKAKSCPNHARTRFRAQRRKRCEVTMEIVEIGNVSAVYHAIGSTGCRSHHAASCSCHRLRRSGWRIRRGRTASASVWHLRASARVLRSRTRCYKPRKRRTQND